MNPIPFPTGFAFSQSSLQDYSDCPRRFLLRYIQKLQWPAVESEPVLENEKRLQEGKLFHRLVQQHLLGLPAERLNRMVTSPSLRLWWENYLAHPPVLAGAERYPELILSAPLGEHFRLLAKYDLVTLDRESRVVIYDWKTNNRRPGNETLAARWQTRTYRYLLVRAGSQLNGGKELHPEQVELVYWFAVHPVEQARFPYSSGQFQRDQETLLRMVTAIAGDRDFPKTEDERLCSRCVYRSYCDRGIQAGEMDDVEEEMEGSGFSLDQVQEIAY